MTPDMRRADGTRGSSVESRAPVRVFRQIAASRWGKPLLRALSVLGALLVLVAIGSSARAVPQNGSAQTTAAPSSAPSSSSAAPTAPTTTLPTTVITPLGIAPPSPVEHAKRATADDPVLLNSATVDDLERLPGIGPKRATAILDLRGKLGRFRQIEDLMRVKGIGRATLRKLRPIVRLE